MPKYEVEQNYVTFLSPGSFVAETNTKVVDEWSIPNAVAMSTEIVERYGARPYGFYFSTRAREVGELDSKETNRSGVYYLGGEVQTIDDVRAMVESGERDNRILLSNMEGNKWLRVVVTTNGYRWTQPLHDKDVILDLSDF